MISAYSCSMMAFGMGISEPVVSSWPAPLRCAECDDVIGVYEPLVHVCGGAARRTSCAADPEVSCASGRRYHLTCYERLLEEL